MCAVALCPNDKRGELRNEQPWVRVVLCSLAVYLQGLSPTKWVPEEGGVAEYSWSLHATETRSPISLSLNV